MIKIKLIWKNIMGKTLSVDGFVDNVIKVTDNISRISVLVNDYPGVDARVKIIIDSSVYFITTGRIFRYDRDITNPKVYVTVSSIVGQYLLDELNATFDK